MTIRDNLFMTHTLPGMGLKALRTLYDKEREKTDRYPLNVDNRATAGMAEQCTPMLVLVPAVQLVMVLCPQNKKVKCERSCSPSPWPPHGTWSVVPRIPVSPR